jgi:predicted 3-demethylubiquinone-9 3-methyltransferase (glyoxalase superfamily)
VLPAACCPLQRETINGSWGFDVPDVRWHAEQAMTFYTSLFGNSSIEAVERYGFSTGVGWLNDRFGVSWQVNLA